MAATRAEGKMFTLVKPYRQWSEIGLTILLISIGAAVGLSLLDGVLKGPIESGQIAIGSTEHGRAIYVMLTIWVADFRFLAEQAVYAATIFFVGAKFFETRTIFSVGFDKMDASKVKMKGPDDENVVWIGYRYANRMEAEAIAAAFEERLKQSAAV
jgi:hypothetical protein